MYDFPDLRPYLLALIIIFWLFGFGSGWFSHKVLSSYEFTITPKIEQVK